MLPETPRRGLHLAPPRRQSALPDPAPPGSHPPRGPPRAEPDRAGAHGGPFGGKRGAFAVPPRAWSRFGGRPGGEEDPGRRRPTRCRPGEGGGEEARRETEASPGRV